MDTVDITSHRVRAPGRCSSCDAPLAHDQRYCLNCGTRRGPLPARVDAMIRGQRQVEPVFVAERGEPSTDEPQDPPGRRALPTPRVASLAVMAMLVFGVVAGSLTGPGGVESLARTLVVSVSPPAAPPSQSSQLQASSGGGGSSSGSPPAAVTETITEPAPASAGGAGAGASGSSSPAGTSTGTGSGTSSSGLLDLPPIKHVFLIMLSGQGYQQSFGLSTGHPYLAKTLRKQGELLSDYYGVASSSLASGIALISGQGPTQQTAADCPQFLPVSSTSTGKESQVLGTGCVYTAHTQTLPDELDAAGFSWRAYIQGIQDAPTGEPTSCRHPALDANDPAQAAQLGDPYVTWRNPFVYFQSITGTRLCAKDDVALSRLAKDLKKTSTTPSFSYIAPDPCDDGVDQPCTTGAPAGLAAADTFLKSVVPEIEASPAYKQDGLIVITSDQAPQTGVDADTSSCCDQPTFPNLTGASAQTAMTADLTTLTGSPTTDTTDTADTTSTDTTTTMTGTTPDTTSTGTTSTSTTSTDTTTTSTRTTSTDTTTTATTTETTTTSGGPTTTTETTPTGPVSTPGTVTSTTISTPPPVPATSTTTTGTTPAATSPAGTSTGEPPGGGQVGALLISRYVKPGSDDVTGTFNHFSLLKTIEDLFSLKHLGYSNDTALPEFDASVFNATQSS